MLRKYDYLRKEINFYGLPNDVFVGDVGSHTYLLKKGENGRLKDFLALGSCIRFVDYIIVDSYHKFYVVAKNGPGEDYLRLYDDDGQQDFFCTREHRYDVSGKNLRDFDFCRGVYGFSENDDSSRISYLFLLNSIYGLTKFDLKKLFFDKLENFPITFLSEDVDVSILPENLEDKTGYFRVAFSFSDLDVIHAAFSISNDSSKTVFFSPFIYSESNEKSYDFPSEKDNLMNVETFLESFVGTDLVSNLSRLLTPESKNKRHESAIAFVKEKMKMKNEVRNQG